MAYRGVTVLGIIASLIGLTFAVGCGGKSADEGSGGAISAATGGASASTSGGHGVTGGMPAAMGGMPATGGNVSANGGAAATGGVAALTGGATSASTGGKSAVGGAVPTGGGINTGGLAPTGGRIGVGGAVPTGGGINTGGLAPTGGRTSVGGAAPTGGKSAVGGALATGGSTAIGGSFSTGGVKATGGSSNAGGSASDAGDPLTDFCQGDKSKVLYQGKQEVLAPATSYESALVFDCCMAWGVNLHSKDTLGFDLDIETIWSAGGSIAPGVFTVGTSMQPMRAVVRRSMESPSSSGVPAEGTGELFTPFSFQNSFELGLCLSLYNTATPLWKTLIYVPKVTIATYTSRPRFQFFLLSDSTITPAQASAQALDSLTLAPNPLLDLSKIAYVSSSTNEIGFNPGQKIGDSLQTKIRSISIAVPFVILADGARISLGAFVSEVSSAISPVLNVTLEDIQSDSMVLEPVSAAPNPLKDTRTVTALSETGKLIP
jgi:hypothetical protein